MTEQWRVGEKVHWIVGAVGLQGIVEGIEYIPNGGPYTTLLRIDSEDGHFCAAPHQLGRGDTPEELRKYHTQAYAGKR